jgi:hypothetical protein
MYFLGSSFIREQCYRLTFGFRFAGFFSGFSGGDAWRILRRASSNFIGASVKGLPAFPAGFGFSRVGFTSFYVAQ